MSVALVCFRQGGHRFAVEASGVLAKRLQPPSVSLVLRHTPEENTVIEVSEPVELVTLSLEQIHPVPPFLVGRCSLPRLRALAFDQQGILFILEPR